MIVRQVAFQLELGCSRDMNGVISRQNRVKWQRNGSCGRKKSFSGFMFFRTHVHLVRMAILYTEQAHYI